MLKVGESVYIAVNDGRATLRFARLNTNPDQIRWFVYDCDIEQVQVGTKVPISSGWMTLSAARDLKGAL